MLNGTLFLSIPNEANSGRAITVMGATALVRFVAMERQRVGGVSHGNET